MVKSQKKLFIAILAVVLLVVLLVGAYYVYSSRYSAADIPAEPYKCEKECIVLTTTGQDADNRILPTKPWKVVLKNNSQYTLSIKTSPFDIVDSISGEHVYSQPAPTSAITVNEGGSYTWTITTRNINFDNETIPWSRYSIVLSEDIQDSSIYAPSPTVDIYGSYESLEGDDSGTLGDRIMFEFRQGVKSIIADIGGGDYYTGVNILTEEVKEANGISYEDTINVPKSIVQKAWEKVKIMNIACAQIIEAGAIVSNKATKEAVADGVEHVGRELIKIFNPSKKGDKSKSIGDICLNYIIIDGSYSTQLKIQRYEADERDNTIVKRVSLQRTILETQVNITVEGHGWKASESDAISNNPAPNPSGGSCPEVISSYKINKSSPVILADEKNSKLQYSNERITSTFELPKKELKIDKYTLDNPGKNQAKCCGGSQ